MSTLPRYLLWLDLETTDLNPATALPLEVYWQVTDWDLRPIAEGHGIDGHHVQGDNLPPTTWRDHADSVVIAMHETSGLARLTYWSIDTGPTRRIIQQLAGGLRPRYHPVVLAAETPTEPAHRAKADVTQAQADYATLRRLLTDTGRTYKAERDQLATILTGAGRL